jgi:DNA invertase Pin-like site-specific DNA recombinase
MRIGYARQSRRDKVAGMEGQLRDLAAAGVEERNTYREPISAVKERPQFELVIEHVLRDGDVLVATKIDRVARSVRDFLNIVDRVHGKGARLHILSLGEIDPRTAIGKMTMSMLAAVAEFERDMMLERQVEGIAKARAAGKYRGQPPHARAKTGAVLALSQAGHGPAEIARRLAAGEWPEGVARPARLGGKISERSVYRILKAAKDATDAAAAHIDVGPDFAITGSMVR